MSPFSGRVAQLWGTGVKNCRRCILRPTNKAIQLGRAQASRSYLSLSSCPVNIKQEREEEHVQAFCCGKYVWAQSGLFKGQYPVMLFQLQTRAWLVTTFLSSTPGSPTQPQPWRMWSVNSLCRALTTRSAQLPNGALQERQEPMVHYKSQASAHLSLQLSGSLLVENGAYVSE